MFLAGRNEGSIISDDAGWRQKETAHGPSVRQKGAIDNKHIGRKSKEPTTEGLSAIISSGYFR